MMDYEPSDTPLPTRQKPTKEMGPKDMWNKLDEDYAIC